MGDLPARPTSSRVSLSSRQRIVRFAALTNQNHRPSWSSPRSHPQSPRRSTRRTGGSPPSGRSLLPPDRAGISPHQRPDPRSPQVHQAYRASDRVSQYLIRNVIYRHDQGPEEVFFRIMLFKLFNKIETWELLEEHSGPEPCGVRLRTLRHRCSTQAMPGENASTRRHTSCPLARVASRTAASTGATCAARAR